MSDNVLNVGYNSTPAHGLAATLRLRADGTVWNGSAYEAWSDGSIANYLVALSNSGGGFWGAGMPTGVTAAVLVVDYFDKLAASPASLSDLLLLKSRTINWNGATATAVPAGYTGRYTSVGQLKIRRGTQNITQWSSTDGTGTEDTDAEQAAIQWAEDFIDDLFHGSIYAIPFTASGSALPKTLVEWATILASYYLYDKRGLDDADPKTHKLQADYDRVLEEMQRVVGGTRELRGVAYRTGATRAVQVVAPFENKLSDGAGLVPTTQDRWRGRRFIPGSGWVITN